MSTESFVVPASTLPELARWVSTHRGLPEPEFLHMSEHQLNAEILISLSGSSNYQAILDKGCDSLGVISRFNAMAQLELVGMDYSRAADYAITYDDISSVSVASELPELTEIMLRYAYSDADNEYLGRLLTQNANHHYPDGWSERLDVDTVLTRRSDALVDSERRAGRRFVRRRLYSVTCFVRGIVFRVGDRLHVFHPLWGLDDTGTIWGVERLPGSNEVTVEVEI